MREKIMWMRASDGDSRLSGETFEVSSRWGLVRVVLADTPTPAEDTAEVEKVLGEVFGLSGRRRRAEKLATNRPGNTSQSVEH